MLPQASNWLSWHTFMGANAGRTFLRPFPSLYNLITGSPGSQDPTLWGLSLSGSYVRRSDGPLSCSSRPCEEANELLAVLLSLLNLLKYTNIHL